MQAKRIVQITYQDSSDDIVVMIWDGDERRIIQGNPDDWYELALELADRQQHSNWGKD